MIGADRQLFSAAAELAGVNGEIARGRQTFSVPDVGSDGGTGVAARLGQRRPMSSIRFTAPEPIARHWHGAIRELRQRHGALPVWMGVLLLLRAAVDAWEAQAPDSKPSRWRILERDGWLCQAPGCSSRRNLEVHHVRFRSRGGNHSGENLITLCHAHHQHVLHKGFIRVRGRAPHDLVWEMGTRRGFPPVLKLRDERIESTGLD